MAWTHQDPEGFSARHRAEDHFTTSIDVGDHVARWLVARCADVAERLAIAAPMIVDVGAGSGRLLRQLLDLGFPAGQLLGVDVRPAPPDLPVRWIQGVAPDCVPPLSGILFAHEFLDDVAVDVVSAGHLRNVDGSRGPVADPADLQWLSGRGRADGLVGRRRDQVWSRLVSAVTVGEAIAVDFVGAGVLGYRAGRQVEPCPDGRTDICAGVDLAACRAVTGGRVLPQHRVLAGLSAQTVTERAELAVLRDRNGFGAFGWLITEVGSVGSPA